MRLPKASREAGHQAAIPLSTGQDIVGHPEPALAPQVESPRVWASNPDTRVAAELLSAAAAIFARAGWLDGAVIPEALGITGLR